MPQINPTQINQTIKDKYSIVSNAFRLSSRKKELTKDSKPKDLIITEVGDVKQTEFYPQVKIGRWGDDDNTNEVNLSLRLIDNETGKETLATKGDKIKWRKGDKTARFYEIAPSEQYPEGAFEFDIELAKKPKTNIIEFSLNTKGVDFFYQPALTQQEIDEGANRPENVVGSYAVYASEQKTNYVGGKEYKVGKVGHIYRPKIYDASGAECWGILSVDKEAGKLSVEIPQAFLDKAVYPVVVDPTFGYDTIGMNSLPISYMFGGKFASGGEGNLTKITAYLSYEWADMEGKKFQYAIYDNSDEKVGITAEHEIIGDEEDGWFDLAISNAITNQNYWLYIWGEYLDYQDNSIFCLYDEISGGVIRGVNINLPVYNSWPSTLDGDDFDTGDLSNYKLSIYATYEAGGGAGPANIKTYNGVASASVKTINGVAIASVKTWNGIT